jgi:hypothetical protein
MLEKLITRHFEERSDEKSLFLLRRAFPGKKVRRATVQRPARVSETIVSASACMETF